MMSPKPTLAEAFTANPHGQSPHVIEFAIRQQIGV